MDHAAERAAKVKESESSKQCKARYLFDHMIAYMNEIFDNDIPRSVLDSLEEARFIAIDELDNIAKKS